MITAADLQDKVELQMRFTDETRVKPGHKMGGATFLSQQLKVSHEYRQLQAKVEHDSGGCSEREHPQH